MSKPRHPPHAARRIPLLLGSVVVLGVASWYLPAAFDTRRQLREMREMRERLSLLRRGAEACTAELSRAEAEFQAFHEEVGALRESVRGFETEQEGRVESDRYGDYLDTFDRYNASVEDWQLREEALRVRVRRCRETVEVHNLLADSLRDRVSEAGP